MMAHPLRALLADICEQMDLDANGIVETGAFEVDDQLVVLSSASDDRHVKIALFLDTPPGDQLRGLSRQLLMREFALAHEPMTLHFAMSRATSEIVATLTLPLAEIGTASELMEIVEEVLDEANDELEDAAVMALAEQIQSQNGEMGRFSASGEVRATLEEST